MKSSSVALAVALLSGVSTVAFAQQSTAEDAVGESSHAFEEITVTALRRSESVQSVPAAITAVSGEGLAQKGIVDTSGLIAVVPNIQIAQQGPNALIGIRGIYSVGAASENGNPEIAFSIDGVYQSRPINANAGLFDIDRVEVLRGPQGTLYGRNATGGSINVITKKPTQKFEGNVDVEIGNYDLIRSTGALNVPVSDVIAVRGAYSVENRSGYLGYYNDSKRFSGRLHILAEPTDNFTLLLTGAYTKIGGHGTVDVAAPLEKKPFRNSNMYSENGEQNHRIWSLSAEANLDLGFATLTYIPSYTSTTVDMLTYSSGVEQDIYRPTKQHTQELRLASPSDRFRWVAGLFYLAEDQDYHTIFPGLVDNAALIKNRSRAAFGQATYDITESLRFTAGLRYTKDKVSQNGTAQGGGSINPILGDATFNDLGWKVGVDFDVSDDSLLYATVSTGYKAGGNWSGGPAAISVYGPEDLLAYEVGSKNRFLGGRLQMNVAGFWYDYRDYQATEGLILPLYGFIAATYNAGRARLYGIESEMTYWVTDEGRLTFNATWEHSEFTRFVMPSGFDYTGNRLPMVSKWTAVAGYRHEFVLSGNHKIVADVSSRYTSGYYPEFTNNPDAYQKGYTSTDASITYTLPSDDISISAFVKNIEDKGVIVYATGGGGLATTGNLAAPRTVGLRVGARF